MECMTKASHIIDLKSERSVVIGLLYIINHDKYLDHYRNGFMKYIPYRLLPRIKPKIIEDILRRDHVIGKVIGVNIKPIDFNCKKDLDDYIMGLKKLGAEQFNNLYLEEIQDICKESIEYIEGALNIQISNHEDIRIPYTPLVIREIYNLLGERLEKKEALLICKDKEVSKQMIKLIGKDIKFITILGCNLEDSEEIYNYIFEETGLSIFHSSDINKILGRYHIVINFAEDFNLEASKIKRNAIVFDFSPSNGLDSTIASSRKIIHSIKDFGYRLEDIGINENKWMGSWVDSALYSILDGSLFGQVKLLYIGRDYFSVKDYVNSFIKLKGKL